MYITERCIIQVGHLVDAMPYETKRETQVACKAWACDYTPQYTMDRDCLSM